MEKFLLQDKLFHSISPYINSSSFRSTQEFYKKDYDIVVYKLVNIFKYGKIMCRNSLAKEGLDMSKVCYCNYNGNDSVSLSLHESQNNKFDKNVSREWSSWEMYTSTSISLVFNSNVLDDYCVCEDYSKMPLEVQIKSDISLDYLVGISFPTNNINYHSLSPFFENRFDEDYSFKYYMNNKYSYLKLQAIIGLLKKYDFDVPVISSSTGCYYHDAPSYQKKIQSIVK